MNRSSDLLGTQSSQFASGTPAPAALDRLLQLESTIGALPDAIYRDWRNRLDRLRRQIEQKTCSAAWFDHCWENGGVFPPDADTTPMRPCGCDRCRPIGKLWPAPYTSPRRFGEIDGYISYECHLESLSDWRLAQLPSSRSGVALRAIREARIKLKRRRTGYQLVRRSGYFSSHLCDSKSHTSRKMRESKKNF